MDKEQFFVIYIDGEGLRQMGKLFDTYDEVYDAYCTAMDIGFSCCKICKTIYG